MCFALQLLLLLYVVIRNNSEIIAFMLVWSWLWWWWWCLCCDKIRKFHCISFIVKTFHMFQNWWHLLVVVGRMEDRNRFQSMFRLKNSIEMCVHYVSICVFVLAAWMVSIVKPLTRKMKNNNLTKTFEYLNVKHSMECYLSVDGEIFEFRVVCFIYSFFDRHYRRYIFILSSSCDHHERKIQN